MALEPKSLSVRIWDVLNHQYIGGLALAVTLIVVPTYVLPAFIKLTGAPMNGTVAGFMWLALAVCCAIVWVRSATATAKANLDKKTKAAEDAERAFEINNPSRYVYADIYVEPGQGHGATYHRGGHSTDNTTSVRFGIRLVNSGKQRIRPREMKDIQFRLTWGGSGGLIDWQEKDKLLNYRDTLEGGSGAHVYNVEASHAQMMFTNPPPSTALFGRLDVSGILVIRCEDGEDREIQFAGNAYIPVAIGYTRDMQIAIDALASKLREHSITVADANLAFGLLPGASGGSPPGMIWYLSLLPSVAAIIPTDARELACRTDALESVVARVVDRMSTVGKSGS